MPKGKGMSRQKKKWLELKLVACRLNRSDREFVEMLVMSLCKNNQDCLAGIIIYLIRGKLSLLAS
ncbi:MAG: hypothetical protein A2522_10145 [Gallionellales bacterium RIFOXYD12_FULL_53_10]|nr:MAG: hypothetical protein A2522_10145 [Gallionellales bacterium RIFOXYD12_FULL_53_10]